MVFSALSIWDQLISADRWLFRIINSEWTNPLFDTLLPYFRNPNFWIPLYLFLCVFVLLNFKSKGAWWMLFFILTVALCDMTGTYIFKHNFFRYRPCADPEFYTQVRLLLPHCSGSSSFTSNHAANHFGMATFFTLSFNRIFGKKAALAFLWAFAVAYSQIYVGVHYPLDILGGALIGLFMGSMTARLFNKQFGFAIFD